MKNTCIYIIDFLHPVRGGKEIQQENIGSHPEQEMLQRPVPCQFQEKPPDVGGEEPRRYGQSERDVSLPAVDCLGPGSREDL